MEREPEVSGAASIRDLGGQVGVLAKQRLSGAFLRAGAVDRCLADRGESVVVAVVMLTGFGEAPRAQQEPTNALGNHFIEPRDVVVARRRRVVKHRDAVVGDRVDPIEHEHVEMWVQQPSLTIPVVRDSPSTTGSIHCTDNRWKRSRYRDARTERSPSRTGLAAG
jgi:hypothetical protein